MNYLTVKELMERLSKFDENMVVELSGGESGCGGWAKLNVGKFETRTVELIDGSTYEVEYFDGELVMDY